MFLRTLARGAPAHAPTQELLVITCTVIAQSMHVLGLLAMIKCNLCYFQGEV